ncbi:MAG: sterol desaturase family protein [Candidatus Methylumidiphilus sp.]
MLNRDAEIFNLAGQFQLPQVEQATQPLVESGLADILALAFIGCLLLCVALEWRRPCLRPGKKSLKHSYLTNLSTFLLNDITLSLLSIPSLYFIAQQMPGDGLLSGLDDGPAKWALTFLLLDFTLYAWHYATHHFDTLWIFHKVHHSDRVYNVTTGLRFHFGELFLEVLLRVAFIGIMGVSAETVLVCQTVITLFVLFHHTNTHFAGERLLSKLFIVPCLHRTHHSTLRSEHDSNYGAVFSFWDRLFGTLIEREPKAIGLHGVDEQGWLDLVKYGCTTRIQFRQATAPALAPVRAMRRLLAHKS